jgi:hypothetical protein
MNEDTLVRFFWNNGVKTLRAKILLNEYGIRQKYGFMLLLIDGRKHKLFSLFFAFLCKFSVSNAESFLIGQSHYHTFTSLFFYSTLLLHLTLKKIHLCHTCRNGSCFKGFLLWFCRILDNAIGFALIFRLLAKGRSCLTLILATIFSTMFLEAF